jgi:thiol-disulfide isomerase/thioredoxin
MPFSIKGVVNLKDENVTIDKKGNVIIHHPLLNGNTQGFLTVAADWCSHCKHFAPEYEQIAKSTSTAFPCFLITDQEKQAVEKLKIDGFPSLFWINSNGTLTAYTGQRKTLSILDGICKRSRVCNFK